MIDWLKSDQVITQHFTVKDCLFLPKWNRLANENDGLTSEIKNKIISFCSKLEEVRKVLNCPIIVHCMYRPLEYNTLVKGAKSSAHLTGEGVDFDCLPHLTCKEVKDILLPKLEALNIRMENNGDHAGWIHIDTKPVKQDRYFKP